jgi:DNA-binding transcriptional regulator YhcF (GntR family)
MPLKKRRINLYVEPQQWEVLQAIQQETGALPSELVRRAISEYVSARYNDSEVQKMVKAMRAKAKKGAASDH